MAFTIDFIWTSSNPHAFCGALIAGAIAATLCAAFHGKMRAYE